MRKTTLLAVAAIVLIGIWHIATIRPGQDWGDDFALYLAHAQNLARGADYADTGYLYNPAHPTYSPRTYPPVYPLLLAPVVRLFGLNFEAIKVQQVVFLMLLVTVVFFNARRSLPAAYAAGLALLLGLSPLLWLYKDRVTSEIPFMLLVCLAIHLLDADPPRETWRRLAASLLAGVVVYLACGTRAIGVVLLPAIVLADVFRECGQGGRRWRVPGAATFVVLGTFGLCVAVQRAILVLESSYLDQWAYDPYTPLRNLASLAAGGGEFLAGGARFAVGLALVAGLGYYRCVRERVTVRECFVPLYLTALLLWPMGGSTPRFLLPLLPFVLLYFAHAVLWLGSLLRPTWQPRVAMGLGALALAAYVPLYASRLGKPITGVLQPEAQGLFACIREQTPPDAVVVFSKPRALALFTGRRATPAQASATDVDLWDHLRRVGATHFVVGRPFPRSDGPLRAFAERHADRLRVVFRNRDFTAYRVLDLPRSDEVAQAGRNGKR